MAGSILNDKRVTIIVANHLIELAGQLTSVANGVPLTVKQELDNETAEMLAEYANKLRANHGKPALEVQVNTGYGASI